MYIHIYSTSLKDVGFVTLRCAVYGLDSLPTIYVVLLFAVLLRLRQSTNDNPKHRPQLIVDSSDEGNQEPRRMAIQLPYRIPYRTPS